MNKINCVIKSLNIDIFQQFNNFYKGPISQDNLFNPCFFIIDEPLIKDITPNDPFFYLLDITNINFNINLPWDNPLFQGYFLKPLDWSSIENKINWWCNNYNFNKNINNHKLFDFFIEKIPYHRQGILNYYKKYFHGSHLSEPINYHNYNLNLIEKFLFYYYKNTFNIDEIINFINEITIVEIIGFNHENKDLLFYLIYNLINIIPLLKHESHYFHYIEKSQGNFIISNLNLLELFNDKTFEIHVIDGGYSIKNL